MGPLFSLPFAIPHWSHLELVALPVHINLSLENDLVTWCLSSGHISPEPPQKEPGQYLQPGKPAPFRVGVGALVTRLQELENLG